MIQQTFKLFIPAGTDISSYKNWDDILSDILQKIGINNKITDDNVMLHIGITIGKAEAGATVKPEW